MLMRGKDKNGPPFFTARPSRLIGYIKKGKDLIRQEKLRQKVGDKNIIGHTE